MRARASLSGLRVRLKSELGDLPGSHQVFFGPFRIGRDESCEIQVPSPLVSRSHAEVWPDGSAWWVRDLGSTNGLFLNGVRVERGELEDGASLQLGKGAPILSVSLVRRHPPGAEPIPTGTARAGGAESGGEPEAGAPAGVPQRSAVAEPAATTGRPAVEVVSLAEIEEKYLNPESDRPAGERTRFIRLAFARVQERQRKRARLLLGAGALILASALAFGLYQRQRVATLDRQAAQFFQAVKAYEVTLFTLRQEVEQAGSPELLEELAAVESARRSALQTYDAFVRERGLYRKLRTREDTLIYETARAFGESEFDISGAFVDAVLREIRQYWLTPGGRTRYLQAVERAGSNGYTGTIVRALTRRGVPVEFYYLALQESDFVPTAVGPPTRWGRAKGMWQFIPTTAQRYGLSTGTLDHTAEVDAADERHDVELSTDAAARYLRDLHGILTQASGLLVMAAYNWGEHRVAPRLQDLPEPRDVFREEFAGVPTTPAERNYWTFLERYGPRMPAETKQYVIRIFAAAVIGRDPEYFGLQIADPLAVGGG